MGRFGKYMVFLLASLLFGVMPAGHYCAAALTSLPSNDANIYFSHLNSSNSDLSFNCVNTLIQDRHGFVWAGTSDGLNRYGGNSIRVYGKEDLKLNTAFVVSLFEDSEGIWIGTDSGVAFYNYNTDCIEPFNLASDTGSRIRGKATAITSDRNGNIWFAVNEQGVFKYDRNSGKVTNYFSSKGKRLPANVRSIYFHPDGRCWISLYYHNLYTPDWKNQTISPVSVDGNPNTFRGDNIVGFTDNLRHGVFLTSTRHGLCEIDSACRMTQHFFPGNGFEPEGMCFDSDRRVWIASLSGIYRYNTVTGAWDHFTAEPRSPFSLSENFTHAVLMDRNGRLWVGTNGAGLDYAELRDNNFHKIFIPSLSGTASAGVTGMSIDADGNIWCSTMRSGIMMCPTGSRTFVPFDMPGHQGEFFSIFCAGDDVWTSSVSGILRINRKTGQIRLYDHLVPDTKLMESRLCSIFETARGEILINTTLGIYRYNPATDNFSQFAGLTKNYVTGVIEDLKGNLWISTFASGLIYYDPIGRKVLKHYVHNRADGASLPSNKLLGVMRDHLGRIWTNSFGGGVSMLDEATGTFRTYSRASTANQSVSDVAYAIVEDEDGILWVSTNKGLMRLNPTNGQTQVYNLANGLLNSGFSNANGFRTADGDIYFCSADGLTVFNPRNFKSSEINGPVVITSLAVNGNEVKAGASGSPLTRGIDLTDRINLPHNQNSIEFFISDMGTRGAPGESGLSYTLTGLDAVWKPVSADGRIEFSNLPPGDYILQFRREIGDSIDTTVHSPIKVHVGQVFYKTRWAVAIYIILGLLLLSGAIYLYYRRQIRKERIDRENLLRAQEIEAYNEKMALFSAIASRLRSPLALIRNPLKNILRNHHDGSELIDDLMVISNGADQLSNILQDFDSEAEEQANAAPATPPVAGDDAAMAIDTDTRQPAGQSYVVNPIGGNIHKISDADAEFIRRFDEIVMENLGDSEFGNEQLASKLAMSKSTLIRRTKSVLDTTPNDYILNKRLSIAAEMLNSSGCRINEVCYSVGFNTPSYFTKCFKRVYGILPTEYRDSSAGGETAPESDIPQQ